MHANRVWVGQAAQNANVLMTALVMVPATSSLGNVLVVRDGMGTVASISHVQYLIAPRMDSARRNTVCANAIQDSEAKVVKSGCARMGVNAGGKVLAIMSLENAIVSQDGKVMSAPRGFVLEPLQVATALAMGCAMPKKGNASVSRDLEAATAKRVNVTRTVTDLGNVQEGSAPAFKAILGWRVTRSPVPTPNALGTVCVTRRREPVCAKEVGEGRNVQVVNAQCAVQGMGNVTPFQRLAHVQKVSQERVARPAHARTTALEGVNAKGKLVHANASQDMEDTTALSEYATSNAWDEVNAIPGCASAKVVTLD